MSGSVVWATVVGLLLGCVIGVAGMGMFLLPVQFNLEQEQLRSKQQMQEMDEQQLSNAQILEEARRNQRRAEAQQVQLLKEKKQLELRYADAVRQLDEANRKLNKKP